MNKYILDENNKPVICNDLIAWGRWFETAKRQIAKSEVGDARVSTVFLGLDHNFTHGDPVLWETMIFGGPHDGYQERYTSHEDALRGHETAVALAQTTPETLSEA